MVRGIAQKRYYPFEVQGRRKSIPGLFAGPDALLIFIRQNFAGPPVGRKSISRK